jgi:CubicO group peptidase (beta-lactamase class C family)
VPNVRTVIVGFVLVVVATAVPGSAQTIPYTFSVFQRYLESYREQYGIPGLSAVVVDHGDVVWKVGLGTQDLEAGTAATPDTAYFVGDLSQIFGSTLLLEKCYDQDTLELKDQIIRWVPSYDNPDTTVGQLLTHQTASGAYAYDPRRFAGLTAVIEECADLPYRHVLASEIFNRMTMSRSVPGRALDGVQSPGKASFSAGDLARYNDVLSQMARHYRIDRGQPVRTAAPQIAADASTGTITSATDLAAFDKALRTPGLLSRDAITLMWTQAGGASPLQTGLGWFVQRYKDEPLIWQFDLTKDVASSLIVKLPNRDLTFILLANSDGITRNSNLAAGDALASPFVKLFLSFFVP